MKFLEVSSKSGANVHEAFTQLTKEIKEKKDNIPTLPVVDNVVTVNGLKASRKKNCEC
jgi:hypothetical protein